MSPLTANCRLRFELDGVMVGVGVTVGEMVRVGVIVGTSGPAGGSVASGVSVGSSGPAGGSVASIVAEGWGVSVAPMVGNSRAVAVSVGTAVGCRVQVGSGVGVGLKLPDGMATITRLMTMLPTMTMLRSHRTFWLVVCLLRLLTKASLREKSSGIIPQVGILSKKPWEAGEVKLDAKVRNQKSASCSLQKRAHPL